MSQNEFEKILDGIKISSKDATTLLLLALKISARNPNTRLKEIVDAKKLFDAQQESPKLSPTAGSSRAERRAIAKASKKKGTKRKKR
jgi:hypothetical protein